VPPHWPGAMCRVVEERDVPMISAVPRWSGPAGMLARPPASARTVAEQGQARSGRLEVAGVASSLARIILMMHDARLSQPE